MANQAQQSENVRSAPVTSEATRVGQFMRMNPPKFTVTKVEEDLQEFIEEMEKIFILGVIMDSLEESNFNLQKIKNYIKNHPETKHLQIKDEDLIIVF
ncbi:MAG: hypothetical protein Q8842_02870, partial [Candidatus Phytoplasma australasiaticum]|nr:hypothetical protein [Candidatus Phytoplasma australasiaticum]